MLTRLPLCPIASARRGPSRSVGWAFSQTVLPGGGVPAVGDGEVAGERRDPPLVEDLADHAQVLVDHQVRAVGDPHAGRLLAAVLEREQRRRRHGRGLVAAVGQHDARRRRTSAGHLGTRERGIGDVVRRRRRPPSPAPAAARAPTRAAGPSTATSSASAIRLPRSSAAPVAPSPASSTRSAGPPVVPSALDVQAVLAREQLEGRHVAREPPRTTSRDGLSPNSATAGESPTGSRRRAPRDRPRCTSRRRRRRSRRRTRPGSSRRGPRAMASRMNAWSRFSRSRSSGGGPSSVAPPGEPLVLGAGEARAGLAHEQHGVVVGGERGPDARRDVREQAHDADLRRGRDRRSRRLVVQRDVAAGDRQAQGDAGVGEAADALGELPEGLGARGIAVVEAVGDAQRPGARDRHVAGRLGDRHRGAQPRVEHADRGVAVGRGDERLGGALDPQDRGARGRGRRRCWTGRWSRTARRPGGARRGSASRAAPAARPRVLAAQRQVVHGLGGRAGGGRGAAPGGARDSRSNTIASDASARAGMRASSMAPGTGRPSASSAPRPSGP